MADSDDLESPWNHVRLASDGQDDMEEEQVGHGPLLSSQEARRWLYLSHAFNQFSELAWQFCIILFLTTLSTNSDDTQGASLLWVSTYGLVVGVATTLALPWMGHVLDRSKTRRWALIARWILGENICVVLAAASCTIILKWTDTVSFLPLVGIHLFGAAAQVLDRSVLVALEKDWIVAMSHAYESNQVQEEGFLMASSSRKQDWLSQTNVRLKQIDLSAQVLAPTISGWVITMFHNNALATGLLWVTIINVCALGVELYSLHKLYQSIPSLQSDETSTEGILSSPSSEAAMDTHEEEGDPRPHHSICSSFQAYVSLGPLALAGISLAMLHLNVLTFSGLMTGYLIAQGRLRLDVIGFWRGVSSIIGLCGTFCFSLLHERWHWSLVRTGGVGLLWEWLWLTLAATSVLAESSSVLSLALLIGGVIPSRIGLWVTDIAIVQWMQEQVPAPVRGRVGGLQSSLEATCSWIPFGLGILFSRPSQFGLVFVLGGYGAVSMSLLVYSFAWYRVSRSTRPDPTTRSGIALTVLPREDPDENALPG